MSSVAAHLKKAKEAIDKKDWKEAKKNAGLAIKADKQNYNACVLFGLASKNICGELLLKVPFTEKSFPRPKEDSEYSDDDEEEEEKEKEKEEPIDAETKELMTQRDQNMAQAEQAYRKATQLAPASPLGWKGLEDLYSLLPSHAKLAERIDVYQHLIETLPPAKAGEFIEKLAYAEASAGDYIAAAQEMQKLVSAAKDSEKENILETFSRLAKIADWTEEAAERERPTLDPVRGKTRAQLVREREYDPTYAYRRDLDDALEAVVDYSKKAGGLIGAKAVPYRVMLVHRLRRRMVIEKQADASERYRCECAGLVSSPCTDPVPYEYVLNASDEDSPLLPGGGGGGGEKDEENAILNCAERYFHLYPQSPLASAYVMAFLANKITDKKGLSSVLRALTTALTAISSSSSSFQQLTTLLHPPLRPWCALVEIRIRLEDYAAGLTDSETALRLLSQRASAQPKRSFNNLRRRLLVAKGSALAGMGRSKHAIEAFTSVLSEDPTNLTAAKCLFDVYLHENMFNEALQLCEERKTTTTTTTKTDDAWNAGSAGIALLHLCRLDDAAARLEHAVAMEEMSPVWHCWLGRVYWAMGGVRRTGKAHAHAQFMAAARLGTPSKDPSAAAAFAYLGEYYRVVDHNTARAAQCYQKAVALNVLDPVAGPQLAQLYNSQGKPSECAALCRRVTAADMRSPATVWAWAMLGAHQIREGKYETAALSFLAALKHQPSSQPKLWQLLAETYRLSGRYVAAQKAAYRTIEIAPNDPYSLYQVAAIELLLFQVEDAQEAFERLMKNDSSNNTNNANTNTNTNNALTLFRKGYVEASLLRSKKENILGRTADSLASLENALRVCEEAVASTKEGSSTLPAALWKLYGDTCTEFLSFWDSPAVGNNVRIASLADTGLAAYRKASTVRPASSLLGDCAINRYRKALSAHVPEALREAEAFAREALATDATNPALWNILGVILMEEEEEEEKNAVNNNGGYAKRRSQRCFATALQYDPKNVSVLNNMGLLALRCSDLECAYKAFTQLQAVDYLSPYGWNGVGLVREAIGYSACAPVVALTAYEQARDLGLPPAALPGLGVASLLSGNPTQAIVVLSKCVEHGSADPSVHHALALAYEARGLYHLALRAVDSAIRLGKACFSQETPSEPYKLSLLKSSDNSLMFATKARVLCALGMFSDSASAASMSSAESARSIKSYCLAKLGKYKEALSLITKLTTTTSEPPEALSLAQARLQHKAGDAKGAWATLEKLTAERPECAVAWVALAALTMDQGKDPLPTLSAARRAAPLCCEVEVMCAVAHLRAGNTAAALVCAQKASLCDVNDSRAWAAAAYIALVAAEKSENSATAAAAASLVFLRSAGRCEDEEMLYALAYIANARGKTRNVNLARSLGYIERHLHTAPEDAFGWSLHKAVSALVAEPGSSASPWKQCVSAVNGPLMNHVCFPMKLTIN